MFRAFDRWLGRLLKPWLIGQLKRRGAPFESFDGIWIHEDDEGLSQLFPVAAEQAVFDDMDASAEASERNRSADGGGWDAMHQISQPAVTYQTVCLSLAVVCEALAPVLPRVRRYRATVGSAMYSADRDPFGRYEEDAHCYGFDANCFLKLEAINGALSAIWYLIDTNAPERLAAMKDAFQRIDRLSPSIVADYRMRRGGRVADASFLGSYFHATANHVSAASARFGDVSAP